ncbi:MAG: ABC transporter permease, partial [Paraclostridium sp.]
MDIIKNAIENIKTNKLRVAVAMIWIILGITSVVVLSSLGNGISKQLDKTQQDPDYRKVGIQFTGNYSDMENQSFFEPFTEDDVDMASLIKGVERATPRYGETEGGSVYGSIVESRNDSTFTKFTQYNDKLNLDIGYGRSFSLDDLERNTIILDYSTARYLFNDVARTAIGKSVDIKGEKFEVIGVINKEKLTPKEMKKPQNKEHEAYLPKKSLEQIAYNESFSGDLNGIDLVIAPGYDIDEVTENVSRALDDIKGVPMYSYVGSGHGDEASELKYISYTVNRFTGILTSASLLIGGIGITNVMYMAVAERQREIGIRRAIGAEPKDIMLQFVIETVVITLMGGVVGMIIGTFAADYVGGYFGFGAMASVEVYIKALLVSMLTGVVFGSIPAAKAAKLD